MADTLGCIGCQKTLPITRFSKQQRREDEPECISCVQWREMNAGDSVPTPPPGAIHALRAHEKSGTIARVLPATSAQGANLSSVVSSAASMSSAASAAARPYGLYDADDFDDQDNVSTM